MLALTGRPAAGSPGGSACACSPSRAAHAREPPPAVASGAELAASAWPSIVIPGCPLRPRN